MQTQTQQAGDINRFKLYQEAKKIIEARIGFLIHLGIFLAVNALLFVINLSALSHTGYWFVWPALLWGAGLLVHGSFVLLYSHKNIYRLQQEGLGKKTMEMLLGLSVHWSLFLIMNLLLVAINLVTYSGNAERGFWSIWIVLGWGIGIGFHSVWVYLNKDHKLKRWKRQKALKLMDRWGELS